MKNHKRFGQNFFSIVKHARKSQKEKNKIIVTIQIIALAIITVMMLQVIMGS